MAWSKMSNGVIPLTEAFFCPLPKGLFPIQCLRCFFLKDYFYNYGKHYDHHFIAFWNDLSCGS
jgi:hypothetical protein